MSEPTASQHLEDILAICPIDTMPLTHAKALSALERLAEVKAALEAIRDRWAPIPNNPGRLPGCDCEVCLTHTDAVRGLAALTPNTPTKEQA